MVRCGFQVVPHFDCGGGETVVCACDEFAVGAVPTKLCNLGAIATRAPTIVSEAITAVTMNPLVGR